VERIASVILTVVAAVRPVFAAFAPTVVLFGIGVAGIGNNCGRRQTQKDACGSTSSSIVVMVVVVC
jgi:hypothetical protein